MNEKISFNLDPCTEPEADVEGRVQHLNSMLNKHGIWFSLVYDKDDRMKILISVNPETLKRNAGKHKQDIYLPDTTSRCGKHICTVEEIRKMESAGMSSSVIADLIRISKSTYFRRKKAAAGKQGWEAF
jgi:hypothetical protein